MAVHMIVLAAGFSTRYGKNKLLVPFLGKPLYLHVVDELSEIQKIKRDNATLTVVTQYQKIFQEMQERKVPVVYNNHSDDGISSSLQTGLQSAMSGIKDKTEKQYFCFFVGDQPYLQQNTIEKFLDGFIKSGKGMGCLKWEDRTGNPVIFSEEYTDELMKLTGDVGGKKILKAHSEDVYYYKVRNKMELLDIDRPKNSL